MKFLIAFVVLVVLGLVGVVVFKESSRQATSAGPVTPGATVATISNGESVDVTDHLTPGKFTVVEFYADW